MTEALRDAVARAINEAVLRVTDGTVQFDDEQLRRIGDEFLYGEKTFGLNASIEPYARAARILVHERIVAPANRRPAPTVDEVWKAHPDLAEQQAENLAAYDPDQNVDYRLFALVPQPLYSPDTPFEDLPQRIIRQCCPGKTCGGTTLHLVREDTVQGPSYGYRRDSNDEWHGPYGDTVAELVERLNDPNGWPNHHSDVWGYVGTDGFDANAPAG